MEKANIHGVMEDTTKVNIKMIKNKDMGNTFFKMEKFLKDNGKMENSMEKESFFILMVKYL